MKIDIHIKKLSDGSKVYDLTVTKHVDWITFHCISEAHAKALELALRQHTLDFEV